MRPTRLLPVTLITLALSTTVACQVEATERAEPARTQVSAPASTGGSDSSDSGPTPVGETLKIGGNPTTQSRDCAGRDVVVDGQGVVADLTGTCGNLTVKGTGNQVTVEKVAAITVAGTGHVVHWGSATDGGEPKVTNSGTGNTVTRK